jgi:two-component sensor histidine kinase
MPWSQTVNAPAAGDFGTGDFGAGNLGAGNLGAGNLGAGNLGAGDLEGAQGNAARPRRDFLRVLRTRQAGGSPRLWPKGGIGLRGRVAGALAAMAATHRRFARELDALAREVDGPRRIRPVPAGARSGLSGTLPGTGGIAGRLKTLLDGPGDAGLRHTAAFDAAFHAASFDAVRVDAVTLDSDIPQAALPEAATAISAMIRRIGALADEVTDLERRVAAGEAALMRSQQCLLAERREAQDREARLTCEVDHRTRNALAVVRAIVSLTRAPDITAYATAVERRVHALARGHSLLSDSCWRGASITDLVTGEVTALRGAHAAGIAMSGPDVTLDSAAVPPLVLALAELAANAACHGALSGRFGRLLVVWEERDDAFRITWSESWSQSRTEQVKDDAVREAQDGTRSAEGLGLRIVRANVEGHLSGRVAFDWRRDGMTCAIDLPYQLITRSGPVGDL